MYGYIYKTTNLINGKIYIGQKKGSEFYPQYKGSGKLIRKAIEKYGWENFSIEMLCPCFSKEELDAEEVLLISYFNSQDKSVGYNITKGGERGPGGPRFLGHKHTEESKELISKKLLGKKKSDITRSRMSKATSGKPKGPMPTETRKKISMATSGENNPFYGKHHSQTTRDHWSQIRKGQTHNYTFICTECGRESNGHGSRQHICSECKSAILAARAAKVYNKHYNVVCKICGEHFMGNSPKSNRCSKCKGDDLK